MNMDMHMGMSTAPMTMSPMSMSPSPMMAHSHAPMNMAMGEMDMEMGTMDMSMWFQATTRATLWLREWTTESKGKYAASIIGLLVLCVLQEALVWLRLYIARTASGARRSRPADIESASGVTHPDHALVMIVARFGNPIVLRLMLSFLYGLNVASSYLLMLAVMTYNVGYFIVIALGLTFGHLLFMRIEQPVISGNMSDQCCANMCYPSQPPCCQPKNEDIKLNSAA